MGCVLCEQPRPLVLLQSSLALMLCVVVGYCPVPHVAIACVAIVQLDGYIESPGFGLVV